MTTDQIAQAEANLEATRVTGGRGAGGVREREDRLRACAAHDEGCDRHAGTARRDEDSVRGRQVQARSSREADRRASGRPSRWPSPRPSRSRSGGISCRQIGSSRPPRRRSRRRPMCAWPIPRFTRQSAASSMFARRWPARSSRRGNRSSRSSILTTCGCESMWKRPTSIAFAWETR